MTYTWSITDCNYLVANGFITTAVWECVATDDGYTEKVDGVTNFANSDPQIPYVDVTETAMLEWLYEIIDKDEIESGLAAKIELQKNPLVLSGLPWLTTN